MKYFLIGILVFATISSLPTQAKPEPLVIDQTQEKTKAKYIKSAHDVISHHMSIEQARFTILQATLTDEKAKWIMEEDGTNYIIVRRDRAGQVEYAKIEYNENHIQLKYIDRKSDYLCENNVNGICYKSSTREYYRNFKSLRNLIRRLVKKGEKS